MRFLSAHAQHIGSRSYQQDAYEFLEPGDAVFALHGGFLAVICDGMGGMEHGDLASKTAIAAVVAEYAKKTPEESIPDALVRSVREANSQVLAAAGGLGVLQGMGTTLVAVVVLDDQYHFISVGDSGLFHIREGKATLVNRAHVFGNLLDRAAETGTISHQAASIHPEREALTSFIGIETLDEIDRSESPLPLPGGETLLLATDGLFKTLDSAEIDVQLHGHPQSWPSRLVAATLDKQNSKQDNVTVVMVTADVPAHGLPPPEERKDSFTYVPDRALAGEPSDGLVPKSAETDPRPIPDGDSEDDKDTHVIFLSRGALLAALVALVLLAVGATFAGWWVGGGR